jgi:cellulose synthase operon protein B
MKPGTRKALAFLSILFALVIQTAQAGPSQYSIQFKSQLKIPEDLKLTGAMPSAAVRFTCETSWKPEAGSSLHLFISHSPNLDGGRSFLSISLNYGVLRSLRLDELNQATTEVVVPVPPEMLKPENEIVFSAEQFPASRSSGEIWTAIKTTSFINVEYEETRPMLDLRLLPSPLIDSRSYRPRQLSVLVPKAPSSQTLEATALLIANYAADVSDSVTVHAVESMEAASGPLLIIGTSDEQPIRLLETRLGLKHQDPLDVDEGLIFLAQRLGKTFSPTLVVTGNTPKAVSRGVWKLIEGRFEDPGTFARASQDEIRPSLLPRKWKGFLPPHNHFTLSEMGIDEVKFDSQNGFSASLPLPATPDTRFLAYGQQATLAFRFAPDISTEGAFLDIHLNGSSLGQFKAAEFSGSRTSVRLKIPGGQLRQRNVLDLSWHGLEGSHGANPAVWLLPASEFDLPHDYQSNLPNLELLQYALFPFGLRSDLSDTAIVLPDRPEAEMVAALFEFAGLLGRLVPSDRFAFAVKYSSESAAAADLNRIAFKIGVLSKGVSAAIQETAAPSSTGKYQLNVLSTSPQALRAAIKTVFSEDVLKQLRGDTADIRADRVSSFKTTPVRRTYEYSYSTHLQAWLRENWIALPVIIVSASCLLFIGLRLALAQYKSKR